MAEALIDLGRLAAGGVLLVVLLAAGVLEGAHLADVHLHLVSDSDCKEK